VGPLQAITTAPSGANSGWHTQTHARNVKRWRDGQMALRWCAAGMVEAGKQFRRVNGHLHLRALRDTLNKVTEPVGATGHDETVNAA
jgi:putative transposase